MGTKASVVFFVVTLVTAQNPLRFAAAVIGRTMTMSTLIGLSCMGRLDKLAIDLSLSKLRIPISLMINLVVFLMTTRMTLAILITPDDGRQVLCQRMTSWSMIVGIILSSAPCVCET